MSKEKKLTPQQELFCQYAASGMTQSDAYRKAYPKSKAKAKTQNEMASKMMAQNNISTRVRELQEEMKQKFIWTKEKATELLMKIAGDEVNERSSDQINAMKELNKIHGLEAPNKHEITNPDGSMSQPSVIKIVHVEPENGPE